MRMCPQMASEISRRECLGMEGDRLRREFETTKMPLGCAWGLELE